MTIMLAVILFALLSILTPAIVLSSIVRIKLWLRRRNNGRWVIDAQLAFKLSLLKLIHLPRFMDKLIWYVFQFWAPMTDVVTMLVVIFRLLHNIEAIQAAPRLPGSRTPVVPVRVNICQDVWNR